MRIKNYSRWLRQNQFLSLLIFGSIFVVIFNECIVYRQASWQWHQLHCNSDKCTRILLVADPQILGETFDRNFYNSFAIQDCDRFLRKTFQLALKHVEPDVIVFLGDLLDEGSVATTDEFWSYVHRFKDVFHVPSDNVSLMYISGDNDVGGEGGDPVTAEKVGRFKDAFDERGYIDVGNRLRIFNVNQFTHYFPNVTKDDTPDSYNRIVVTHMSLLSFPGIFTEKVNLNIQPHVIFSAHQHSSRIITYSPIRLKDFNRDSTTISFDLHERKSNNKLEIMVPTSSYRMGSKEIGYGYGVLEKSRLQYTVLWLPNRFVYLYIYLIWLGVSTLFPILYLLVRKCHRNKRSQLDIHHLRYEP